MRRPSVLTPAVLVAVCHYLALRPLTAASVRKLVQILEVRWIHVVCQWRDARSLF